MIAIDSGAAHGAVAPGFEPVATAFAASLARRDALGAACAIHHQGKKVVDLWGGPAAADTAGAWRDDGIVLMYSVTKGLTGVACAVAVSQGLFDYDEPVAVIWPEFAAGGKAGITVGALLSEQAGLAALDVKLTRTNMADQDAMAAAIAAQTPNWSPGDLAGNHSYSLGWIACELIRRRDPRRRTLGQFFADEVARPLGADVWMGLPAEVDRTRLARVAGFGLLDLVFRHRNMPWSLVLACFLPWSLPFRALNNPLFLHGAAALDAEEWRGVELGAIGGIGSARAVAACYAALADGGAALGVRPDVIARLSAGFPAPRRGRRDAVLHFGIDYSYGLEKPSDAWRFAPSRAAFGSFAVGGSLAFADPERGVGYAWLTNKLNLYGRDDPRELMVRQALYRVIGHDLPQGN